MRVMRARPVHTGQRFVLLAIESVESHGHRSPEGCRFSALVEPIALVVCGHGPPRALDMHGEPVDIDALRRDVPALDSDLATCEQKREGAR